MIKVGTVQMMTPGDLSADLNLCISAFDSYKESYLSRQTRQGLFASIIKKHKIKFFIDGLLIRDEHVIYDSDTINET